MATADSNSASGPTSEAAALAGIVARSASCPGWQRDALQRLCTSEVLTPHDLDELLAICKGEAEGRFLKADDVRDPSAGGAAVTLGQLHGVLRLPVRISLHRFKRRTLPRLREPKSE